MNSTFKFLLLTFTFVAVAAAASAQVRTPTRTSASQTPRWRWIVGVDIGVQPERTESQSFSVEKNQEQAPIVTTLHLERATFLDVTVGFAHAQSRLGASVGLSSLSRKFGGDVSAQIPHPFFFNTPRPVSGSAPDLRDTEWALHLDATYQVLRSSHVEVVGFAGPSVFTVRQDLVTDVTYTDAYPYDTATFGSALTARTSVTAFGFNLGTDLTWKFSRRVGVGALVRYAHGSATLTPSAGNNVSGVAGGLALGGGLRLLY